MASVSSASARLPLTPNVQPRARLYTGWFESVQADLVLVSLVRNIQNGKLFFFFKSMEIFVVGP